MKDEDWMAWESQRVHGQDRTGLVIESAMMLGEPPSWLMRVHEEIAYFGEAVCTELAEARTTLFVMVLCFAGLAACGGVMRSWAQPTPADSNGSGKPASAASALGAP